MSSKVYFSKSIDTRGVNGILDGLNLKRMVKAGDKCALKIHFGEKGNKGYVKPQFVKPMVERLTSLKAKPFLTDTCTNYVGSRHEAVSHALIAAEHGFTVENCGCPVIIAGGLLGNDGVELKIERGNMEKALIANELYQADSIVFINHFKGHMFSGFGGAMKNISMGCATRDGKEAMHSRIKPRIKPGVCKACGECVKLCLSSALALVDGRISLDADKCRGCGVCVHHCKRKVLYVQWSECMDNFQQNLCDYCYAVVKNKKLTCITFLNHVTKECDCVGTPQKPYMDNIGILAGDDPLAVDQASVDMINREFGSDFCRHIFPHIDYTTQLAYAEKIGIGTRKYVIINV